jgi:hypothetical protein
MIPGDATHTKFMECGLTLLENEVTIFHIRGKYVEYNTTETVSLTRLENENNIFHTRGKRVG